MENGNRASLMAVWAVCNIGDATRGKKRFRWIREEVQMERKINIHG